MDEFLALLKLVYFVLMFGLVSWAAMWGVAATGDLLQEPDVTSDGLDEADGPEPASSPEPDQSEHPPSPGS